MNAKYGTKLILLRPIYYTNRKSKVIYNQTIRLISEFSNVTEYKVNIYKNQIVILSNNKQIENKNFYNINHLGEYLTE